MKKQKRELRQPLSLGSLKANKGKKYMNIDIKPQQVGCAQSAPG